MNIYKVRIDDVSTVRWWLFKMKNTLINSFERIRLMPHGQPFPDHDTSLTALKK